MAGAARQVPVGRRLATADLNLNGVTGRAARAPERSNAMMWYSNGSSWVGWLVMSLMMLIFWGGLIALIVWCVRQPRGQGNDKTSPDKSPTTILEERFARGDIDEEEFHKRRDTLPQASGRK